MCEEKGAFAVGATEPLKKILSIPDDYEVAALIPIGYPEDCFVKQRPISLKRSFIMTDGRDGWIEWKTASVPIIRIGREKVIRNRGLKREETIEKPGLTLAFPEVD